jgi:hypothetical protein
MPNLLDPNADQPEINSITTPPATTGMPQFSTAEYSHIPGTERCKLCGNLISGEYYRVNTLMACGDCAKKVQDGLPTDTHVAFMKALLFGAGAAVLGMIAYATVEIITGWTIGYLALGVGWLVATAMMKGSNKIGGMRYQVAAVLLTYFAISISAVPVAISFAMKNQHKQVQHAQSAAPTANEGSSTSNTATQPANGEEAQSTQTAQSDQSSGQPEKSNKKSTNLGALLIQLLLFGIVSPFLEIAASPSGFIGLIILFVGLSIAFRMTAARPLALDGPFSVNG